MPLLAQIDASRQQLVLGLFQRIYYTTNDSFTLERLLQASSFRPTNVISHVTRYDDTINHKTTLSYS